MVLEPVWLFSSLEMFFCPGSSAVVNKYVCRWWYKVVLSVLFSCPSLSTAAIYAHFITFFFFYLGNVQAEGNETPHFIILLMLPYIILSSLVLFAFWRPHHHHLNQISRFYVKHVIWQSIRIRCNILKLLISACWNINHISDPSSRVFGWVAPWWNVWVEFSVI